MTVKERLHHAYVHELMGTPQPDPDRATAALRGRAGRELEPVGDRGAR